MWLRETSTDQHNHMYTAYGHNTHTWTHVYVPIIYTVSYKLLRWYVLYVYYTQKHTCTHAQYSRGTYMIAYLYTLTCTLQHYTYVHHSMEHTNMHIHVHIITTHKTHMSTLHTPHVCGYIKANIHKINH